MGTHPIFESDFDYLTGMSKRGRKKVEKWLREFETPDRNKRFDLKRRSVRRLVDSISDDSSSENDQNRTDNDSNDSDFSDILPSNLSIIGGHNFNRQIELNSSSVAVQVGSNENISQIEFSFTEGKTLKSRPTQTIPPLVALKKPNTNAQKKPQKAFRIFEDESSNNQPDIPSQSSSRKPFLPLQSIDSNLSKIPKPIKKRQKSVKPIKKKEMTREEKLAMKRRRTKVRESSTSQPKKYKIDGETVFLQRTSS